MEHNVGRLQKHNERDWQVCATHLYRRRMQSSGHFDTKYRIDGTSWIISSLRIILRKVDIFI